MTARRADARNSIVVSGEPNVRKRVIELVKRLDQDQEFVGNTKVIYLKYAKAKNVVEVLNGLGSNIDPEKAGGKAASSPLNAKFAVYGDEETNSVIVNAQPDLMQQIESVITKLDIRRAQVYVEAIIVEMSNSDAAEFGVQWGNTKGGAVLFNRRICPYGISGILHCRIRHESALLFSFDPFQDSFHPFRSLPAQQMDLDPDAVIFAKIQQIRENRMDRIVFLIPLKTLQRQISFAGKAIVTRYNILLCFQFADRVILQNVERSRRISCRDQSSDCFHILRATPDKHEPFRSPCHVFQADIYRKR